MSYLSMLLFKKAVTMILNRLNWPRIHSTSYLWVGWLTFFFESVFNYQLFSTRLQFIQPFCRNRNSEVLRWSLFHSSDTHLKSQEEPVALVHVGCNSVYQPALFLVWNFPFFCIFFFSYSILLWSLIRYVV